MAGPDITGPIIQHVGHIDRVAWIMTRQDIAEHCVNGGGLMTVCLATGCRADQGRGPSTEADCCYAARGRAAWRKYGQMSPAMERDGPSACPFGGEREDRGSARRAPASNSFIIVK